MAKYGMELTRTGNVVSVGVIGAVATTALRRGKIMDLILGVDAAPADATFIWQAQRFTAAGTGTALTPNALDPADSAFLGAVAHIMTVEPTYTAGAIPLSVPMNQRTTFRWVAQPGEELVYPATAANGFGIKQTSASATTCRATVIAEEQ